MTTAKGAGGVSTIKQQIINYIVDTYGIDPSDFDDNTSLFSSGILDSFNMVELVSFVEETAGIRFGVLDLNLDNLDDVGRILRYVNSRMGG